MGGAIVLWALVWAAVGFAVGQPRGDAARAAALCALLGPIGLIIVLATSDGSLRPAARTKKCPFCAELVMVDAVVCKHCGRDLPVQEARSAADVEAAWNEYERDRLRGTD